MATLSPFEGFDEIVARRSKKSTKPTPENPKQQEPKEKEEEAAAPPPKRRRMKKKQLSLTVTAQNPQEHKEKENKIKQDRARKVEIVTLLSAYNQNRILGNYLRNQQKFDLDPVKLRKMRLVDLEELEEMVETVLKNQSHGAFTDSVVAMIMEGLEETTSRHSPYSIQGTTAACFENDHWLFLLERVKVKYNIGMRNLDPATELALVTFQTAALVHNKNKLRRPKTDLDAVIEEKSH